MSSTDEVMDESCLISTYGFDSDYYSTFHVEITSLRYHPPVEITTVTQTTKEDGG